MCICWSKYILYQENNLQKKNKETIVYGAHFTLELKVPEGSSQEVIHYSLHALHSTMLILMHEPLLATTSIEKLPNF